MKNIILIIGVVVLGSVAYYGLSPLWNNVRVNEAAPVTKSEIMDPIDMAPQEMKSEAKKEPRAKVVDTVLHPASGEVLIVEADGKKYVRYENYKTINGPDIYVYLAKDLDAKEYVDLGRVKATEGNINYEIPKGVNPDEYRYVLTWCKKFGVLFNSAEINQEH